MQEIFEMTRSLGQSQYTRFDESDDNENLVHQIYETAATGDAGGKATEAPIGDDRLLHVAEVAEYLRVSQSLVYKMIERKEIPAIRIGRLLRVDRTALEEALKIRRGAR